MRRSGSRNNARRGAWDHVDRLLSGYSCHQQRQRGEWVGPPLTLTGPTAAAKAPILQLFGWSTGQRSWCVHNFEALANKWHLQTRCASKNATLLGVVPPGVPLPGRKGIAPFAVGYREICIYFFKRQDLKPYRFYDADRFSVAIFQDAERSDARQRFTEFLIFPEKRTGGRLGAVQDQPSTFISAFLAIPDAKRLGKQSSNGGRISPRLQELRPEGLGDRAKNGHGNPWSFGCYSTEIFLTHEANHFTSSNYSIRNLQICEIACKVKAVRSSSHASA